eukprot:11051495-Ditylum_brightwellii.AAC.1
MAMMTTNNQLATPARQVSGTKAFCMFIQQNLHRQRIGITPLILGNFLHPSEWCLQVQWAENFNG